MVNEGSIPSPDYGIIDKRREMGLFGGNVEDEELRWFYQKYYYMTEEEITKQIEKYRKEKNDEILEAFIISIQRRENANP
jgi:hypothetical protein